MGKMLELLASQNRRGLINALSVALAGFLIFFFTLFLWLPGISEELIQMTAPGTVDLDLQEVGDYTIFYENVSFIDNRFYSTGDSFPSGLEIKVVDRSSGETVDLRPPWGSSTYNIGGRSGRSIAVFAIDHAGVYRITTWYYQGKEGPEVVLALGHNFMRKMISMMIISFAALLGSIAIAAFMLTSAKRKREVEEGRIREQERMLGIRGPR